MKFWWPRYEKGEGGRTANSTTASRREWHLTDARRGIKTDRGTNEYEKLIYKKEYIRRTKKKKSSKRFKFNVKEICGNQCIQYTRCPSKAI